jgi:hypothetical protein
VATQPAISQTILDIRTPQNRSWAHRWKPPQPAGNPVRDRREFLTTVSALGALLLQPRFPRLVNQAPTVRARPTIFHGHPGGRTTLVRFVATGFGAPAGRLRVFGPRRRQLGTAGMLRVDEVLYGELWVPLERRLAISTELEVPGRRGVIRHRHDLEPQPRWTLYWSTVVDPEILRRHLEALDPLHRGIRAALYAAAGVRVNPLSQIGERSGLDHLPFLRMVLPARLLEREFGIPASSLAVAQSPRSLAPSTALVLAGSGVRVIAFTDGGDELIQRLGGPGDKGVWTVNSRVTGQPDELGFGDSDAEMTAFVERWLTATPPLRSERVGSHAVFVIGDDPTAAPAALATVRRWNGRFAYPRIAIGEYADPFPRAPSDQTSARRTVAVGVATNVTEEALSLAELEALRVTRERMVVERADGLVSTAAAVLGRPGAGLQALTEALAVRFSGTLVFNTAPFTRTDVVTLEDGRDAIVTDVPSARH